MQSCSLSYMYQHLFPTLIFKIIMTNLIVVETMNATSTIPTEKRDAVTDRTENANN
jgi:hypothetical protein